MEPPGITEEPPPIKEDYPIREGIDSLIDPRLLYDDDEQQYVGDEPEQDLTSEEESEAGGVPRTLKGAGWRGMGPPLMARRKGVPRAIIDGGGIPSPGRWAVANRRLPDSLTLQRIQRILTEGLVRCEHSYPRADPFAGGMLRAELLHSACGRRTRFPFPKQALERTREEIREALSEQGFKPGEAERRR